LKYFCFMRTAYLRYDTISLEELAEHLNLNYYEPLGAMTAQASVRLMHLQQADLHENTRKYTEVCSQVLECAMSYLNEYKQSLLPYVKELYLKERNGHNCGTCSGGCDIRHKAYLFRLHDLHTQLRKLLYDLQTAALPLFSPIAYPAAYRDLRDEMLLLDALMLELFHIEEAELMTKIIQSQRKINIHNV